MLKKNILFGKLIINSDLEGLWIVCDRPILFSELPSNSSFLLSNGATPPPTHPIGSVRTVFLVLLFKLLLWITDWHRMCHYTIGVDSEFPNTVQDVLKHSLRSLNSSGVSKYI